MKKYRLVQHSKSDLIFIPNIKKSHIMTGGGSSEDKESMINKIMEKVNSNKPMAGYNYPQMQYPVDQMEVQQNIPQPYNPAMVQQFENQEFQEQFQQQQINDQVEQQQVQQQLQNEQTQQQVQQLKLQQQQELQQLQQQQELELQQVQYPSNEITDVYSQTSEMPSY